jgi:4-amino-4-deoxy-L-arabinose transferase-like glycosyltransferase
VTPDRRTLLALFSLAFGLRILFAVVFGNHPDLVPVRETYDYRIAAQMAQDWHWLTTPFSPNAPGYLMLLALAFTIFGVSWWTAVVLNAVLGGLTTFFLYRVGEKRIGPRAGLYAGVWFALLANPIAFSSYAFRDVTVMFLFAWFMYNLVVPFRRMRVALWLAFLYTLLIMTEPLFIVLLPVLVVYLALFATHHRVLSWQYVFLFLAFFVFFNLPWTIRNYAVHRAFVPVSIEAERFTNPVTHRMRLIAPPTDESLPAEAVIYKEPGFRHNTIEFWRPVRLRDAPADSVHGVIAEPAWSARHNLASALTYGTSLPFMVIGMIFAVWRRHRTALILSGAILSYAIVRGFMTGDDRPRLVIAPLIVLVAVYGIHELLRIRSSAGAPAAET